MTSEAKCASNRTNSQKSTGPKSEPGKRSSRTNAIKLGQYIQLKIIPGEDPLLYELKALEILQHYQPVGPIEELLCEQIISASWRLVRLEHAELVALSRAGIAIVYHELRIDAGQVPPDDADIDYTLRHYLTDTPSATPGGASQPTPPAEIEWKKWAAGEVTMMQTKPPSKMILMKAFSSADSKSPALEIEALMRKVTKYVLSLCAKLEAMQERRKSCAELAVEAEQTCRE